MTFAAKQFRPLVRETLEAFASLCVPALSHSFYADNAVELLMLTCAQETHLGKYLKQVRGPALGIYQMEPATYNDLWGNFISYRQNILTGLNDCFGYSSLPWELRMKLDIAYQTVMARLFYLRVPAAIPPVDHPMSLAHYYKKYFNTRLGKATPEEAYKNYNKYCFK